MDIAFSAVDTSNLFRTQLVHPCRLEPAWHPFWPVRAWQVSQLKPDEAASGAHDVLDASRICAFEYIHRHEIVHQEKEQQRDIQICWNGSSDVNQRYWPNLGLCGWTQVDNVGGEHFQRLFDPVFHQGDSRDMDPVQHCYDQVSPSVYHHAVILYLVRHNRIHSVRQ